ncbi:23S rRNA (pseudouridine(1915)-N(3))-methyltransferase RlmH [Glaciecola petra]|uniref:Ribosomal RNA large subunit methyltransferase H n=1 Tax=Glaciecola petra TaxID=3075602 RepID=A0ABU2ZQ28_9ALTE|nr:23S rRNA (pseudouridine(1915)-N(3))-methyltransferase RlmH [Aestuariibacter sp. P117]MDT0594515.1 23S rRNA (pseudouridine(1915)-N(3))-methyltransferase RlmH [Aestuariibacter sp. P117]
MQVQIVAVGNKMPHWVVEGCNEYLRRFPSDFQVKLTEIAPLKRTKSSNLNKIKIDEGYKCLQAIEPSNKVIALEVKGNAWTTAKLAQQIENWKMDGRNISLLIGGPEGLSDACREKAELHWSLSPLTLPHPMVRVIVSEALYRAWSLTQNHPYHRE